MSRWFPVLAACLALAACQSPPSGAGVSLIVDADPGAPDAEWMRTVTLPPNQFIEANFIMGAGGEVSAVFSTVGGAVSWNLHRHTGESLENIEVLDGGGGASGTLTFDAVEAGAYSYLWENLTGAAIEISVQLAFSGDVRLYGWE